VACDVVAPTLIPTKAGDRVKTDRRDAEKLARLYRSGELTAVWVPTAAHEALRDLVRAREAAKADQVRARHRLGKFLLRHGRRAPAGVRAWTQKYFAWVKGQVHFEHAAQEVTLLDYIAEVEHVAARVLRLEEAIDRAAAEAPARMRAVIDGLQTLRGIAKITAVTIVSEIGEVSRFEGARQLMGYSGLVPSEASSGQRTRRGGITKSGNAHLRRVLGEAAWAYRSRPSLGPALKRRQKGQPEVITEIAWKAQHRLHRTFHRMLGRGKPSQKAVTAVARELVGFIWAIGVEIERSSMAITPKAA
jgi:transposase